MPRKITIEKTVFKFDELSDEAKDHARNKWREGALEYEWWDAIYEDAVRMGKILGIEIENRKDSKQQFKIWFSGFSSQGDGACFEGTYRYRKGGLAELKKEAPAADREGKPCKGNVELHEVAEKLQEIQRRNFYKVYATVKHRGHYYNSSCTEIGVFNDETGNEMPTEVEQDTKDALRLFMDWIYSSLEREHDYLLSDEQVTEAISEFEFDEHGNVA